MLPTLTGTGNLCKCKYPWAPTNMHQFLAERFIKIRIFYLKAKMWVKYHQQDCTAFMVGAAWYGKLHCHLKRTSRSSTTPDVIPELYLLTPLPRCQRWDPEVLSFPYNHPRVFFPIRQGENGWMDVTTAFKRTLVHPILQSVEEGN